MQVITVGRAEGSSRLAAGFVNLQVPPAAQYWEAPGLDEDSSTREWDERSTSLAAYGLAVGG